MTTDGAPGESTWQDRYAAAQEEYRNSGSTLPFWQWYLNTYAGGNYGAEGEEDGGLPVIPPPEVEQPPVFDTKGYLEQNPLGAYYGFLSGRLNTPMQRFFQNRFSDVYGQYQGDLANEARGGKIPTSSFDDYLKGYDFTRKYLSYSPYQRGSNPALTAPRTRWLNY